MMRWCAAAAMLFMLGACSSPCVQLASKICDCQTTQVDRDNCNSQVSARADQVQPTDADEQACSKLVDVCECHELNTPQGKIDCGLAKGTPSSKK